MTANPTDKMFYALWCKDQGGFFVTAIDEGGLMMYDDDKEAVESRRLHIELYEFDPDSLVIVPFSMDLMPGAVDGLNQLYTGQGNPTP